jgi:hypothetical protein
MKNMTVIFKFKPQQQQQHQPHVPHKMDWMVVLQLREEDEANEILKHPSLV